MPRARSPGGRAGFGAATIAAVAFAAGVVMACVADSPTPTSRAPTARPSVVAPASLPTATPAPSTPTDFTLRKIDRAFPSVVALTSTGDALSWGSGAEVWQFTPGDPDPELVYENPADDALIWDIAAVDDAFVLSQLLDPLAGTWSITYIAGEGAPPIEIDGGTAERGAPPTLAIDGRRLAWAGFDEASGSPRSFLRVAERATPASATTLLDLDIDDGLFWYPQLDGDTLWYGIIEPDFEGSGAGDDISIATIDLANPSADPARFDGGDNIFNPAVSAESVVWKSLEPGFAALTWGQLHALDRRSGERFVIADQANNPSLGSRFVAFEEISRQKLLLFDLATRTLVEVPDPMGDANGTVGPVAISGNLLGFAVSAKGSRTILWTLLPG